MPKEDKSRKKTNQKDKRKTKGWEGKKEFLNTIQRLHQLKNELQNITDPKKIQITQKKIENLEEKKRILKKEKKEWEISRRNEQQKKTAARNLAKLHEQIRDKSLTAEERAEKRAEYERFQHILNYIEYYPVGEPYIDMFRKIPPELEAKRNKIFETVKEAVASGKVKQVDGMKIAVKWNLSDYAVELFEKSLDPQQTGKKKAPKVEKDPFFALMDKPEGEQEEEQEEQEEEEEEAPLFSSEEEEEEEEEEKEPPQPWWKKELSFSSFRHRNFRGEEALEPGEEWKGLRSKHFNSVFSTGASNEPKDFLPLQKNTLSRKERAALNDNRWEGNHRGGRGTFSSRGRGERGRGGGRGDIGGGRGGGRGTGDRGRGGDRGGGRGFFGRGRGTTNGSFQSSTPQPTPKHKIF